MEKYTYPQHPFRCMITGPSECRKSSFLRTSILSFCNDFEETYTYSSSLHQAF